MAEADAVAGWSEAMESRFLNSPWQILVLEVEPGTLGMAGIIAVGLTR